MTCLDRNNPKRVWFYHPDLYWFGLRTLLPITFGGDELCRPTIVLGWNFTGQIVIVTGPPDYSDGCKPVEGCA